MSGLILEERILLIAKMGRMRSDFQCPLSGREFVKPFSGCWSSPVYGLLLGAVSGRMCQVIPQNKKEGNQVMKTKASELCATCRSLRSPGGILVEDMCNAGQSNGKLAHMDDDQFNAALYSVLYDGMDGCSMARCCQLVRSRIPSHMGGGR
jgi:hypothetical protein